MTPDQRRVRGERTHIHTPEQIAEEFRYEYGQLFFRKPRAGRSTLRPAGSIGRDNYRRVLLMGQSYLAHRIVWCLHYGRWPAEQIDHIDGNTLNNRIKNLREVTVAENRLNVRTANNASGVVGVTWATKEGNWRASISNKGKAINLGHFRNFDDAVQARKEAEVKYGYLTSQPTEDYK